MRAACGWRTSICSRGCRVSSASTSLPPRTCWRLDSTSACTMCFPGIEEERCGVARRRLPVIAAPESPTADPALWIVCRDREEELAGWRDRQARRAGDAGTDRRRVSASAAISVSRAAGLSRRADAVSGTRCTAAGSRAVCRRARPRFVVREHRSDAAAPSSSCSARRTGRLVGGFGARLPARRRSALDALLRERQVRRAAGIGSRPWPQRRPSSAEHDGPPARVGRGRRRRSLAAASAAAELRARRRGAARIRAARSAARLHCALTSACRSRPTAWYARHLRARAADPGRARIAAPRRTAARRRDRCRFRSWPGRLRRWIEGQTFSPRTGRDGVLLLDAPAAAYADVDEVRIVGLVESDWPERGAPQHLLSVVAPVAARMAGGRGSARRGAGAVPRSAAAAARSACRSRAFTLEDDAIVSRVGVSRGARIARAAGRTRAAPCQRGRACSCTRRCADEPPLASARRRRGGCEWLALRASRRRGRPAVPRRCRRARGRGVRGQPASSAISSARSSTSPRTCCKLPRSATKSRV